MSRSAPRVAPALAPLLVLAALLAGSPAPALANTPGGPPPGGDCGEAISGDNAQKLFEALKKAKPDDGCTLAALRTEGSRATVVWNKGGAAQEGIVVMPTACTAAPTVRGKVLSAIVPKATSASCPAAAAALADILTGDTLVGMKTVSTESASPDAATPPPVRAPEVKRQPILPALRRAFVRILPALAATLVAAAALAAMRWLWWRRSAILGALRPRAAALWTRVRRPRNPSRAGWGAALLLGPHLVLGTWLLVVPDHLAFTAAQIVTLVHVGLALIAFPLAGVWMIWHIRGMRAAHPHASSGSTVVRWLLVGSAIVAAVTGLAALRAGDIASTAAVHAACGVAVGLPLAAHLWQGSRRWAAAAALGLLVAATAGGEAARRLLPPAPAEAVAPAFAYETHPEDRYEPAENCAECHAEDYQDWHRSVHARTLDLRTVQESMENAHDLLHEDLRHIGQILAERDSERPISAALIFGACGSCHAPVSFYGDGKPSLPHPSGVTAEGTGCSFCHTLREVRVSSEAGPSPFDAARNAGARPAPPDMAAPSGAAPAVGARPTVRPMPGEFSRADIFAAMSRAPFFVSAPETVRRYIGQGSKSRLARRIANWLIRWRPQVHARDYHSPVLDDSRACLPCHSLGIDSPDVPHMTYYGWEHSSFNTGDRKTTVECQDCHMVRHMTGEPVNEWARVVPWGPSRPHARSHLFLGGNVLAAKTLGDPQLAAEEHALNTRAGSVGIAHVARDGDMVRVRVTVHSELVGHYFPALETKLRFAWVELRALDAAGNVLGRSPAPRDADDFGCASPIIMASVTDPKPDNQRLVAPRSAREFEGRVTVPAGAEVDRIVADLHIFVDPEPVATATWSRTSAAD